MVKYKRKRRRKQRRKIEKEENPILEKNERKKKLNRILKKCQIVKEINSEKHIKESDKKEF